MVVLASFASLAVLVPSASAIVLHGMTITKGCVSPTAIGSAYECSYTFRNYSDQAKDTVTISKVVDTVHAAAGDVSSGDILPKLKLSIGVYFPGYSAATGAPTCTGAGMTGTGTAADPWIGATLCTLPFGSRINTELHTFYTVQPADITLPGSLLKDDVALTWNDLCNGVADPGCNTNPPVNNASSQTLVTKLASTTTTDIHDAAHAIVTTVPAGSTVHDFVTVRGAVAGGPVPGGNVTLDWFTNGTCAGGPAATSAAIPLGAGGTVDATAFPRGPLAAGQYAFKAKYLGDGTYTGSDGPCEPLTVVDARITITPNSTAPVNTPQTFTVTVQKNDGTGAGWTAATPVTVSSVGSGVGSITGGTCGPTGPTDAAGTCTVTLNSPVAGSNTVNASATVTVGGIAIAVATNGYGAYNIQNVKTWTATSIYVPRTDITVSKTATPSVVLPLGGGSRPIVYDMVVTNNGPDPAANVKVGDSAPADVTFVGATTSAGSCTTTALALDCSLGTLASGGKVTIRIDATVNATGTKVNVVTVTTTTPETNTGNNTAQAQTIVTAPVTPPSPKPTPKPKPEICTAVTAGPKTLKANGKKQTISVTVTKSRNAVAGASVRIVGPGIQRTLKTGANGKILYPIKTKQAGIIRVTVLGPKVCNSQRLGVVGVFEPPITG